MQWSMQADKSQERGHYLFLSTRLIHVEKHFQIAANDTLQRIQDGSTEETDERDCPDLCFFDVPNDINLELDTCSINQSRNKRDIQRHATKRLIGGNTALTGAFPYVVRLAFQNFDQYHSDSQECFRILILEQNRVLLCNTVQII